MGLTYSNYTQSNWYTIHVQGKTWTLTCKACRGTTSHTTMAGAISKFQREHKKCRPKGEKQAKPWRV